MKRLLCVQVGNKPREIATIVVFVTWMESCSWHRWATSMITRQRWMSQKERTKPVGLQVNHVAWWSTYVFVKDCWIMHERVPLHVLSFLLVRVALVSTRCSVCCSRAHDSFAPATISSLNRKPTYQSSGSCTCYQSSSSHRSSRHARVLVHLVRVCAGCSDTTLVDSLGACKLYVSKRRVRRDVSDTMWRTSARRWMADATRLTRRTAFQEAHEQGTRSWTAWKRAGFAVVATNAVGGVASYAWDTHVLVDAVGTGAFAASTCATWTKSARTNAQSVLAACVVAWAMRLGGHLAHRIAQTKHDPRLEPYLQTSHAEEGNFVSKLPWKYMQFWSLQALWAFVSLLPVTAAHALPRTKAPTLRPWALGLFAAFLAMETVADIQKSQYRSNPDNNGHWVDEGLWKYARHPNYGAEIGLWWSVYAMAVTKATAWTVIGPLGVTMLLLKGSGVPVLEKLHEEKYGGNAAYQHYKQNTNLLFPWPHKPQQGTR